MTASRQASARGCLLAFLVAACLCLAGPPPRAQALDLPGPCDVPGVSLVCSAASDAAGAAAGAAGNAVLGQLTGWVGDGASWLVLQVAGAIDQTTAVDLSAPWFARHYAFMFQAGAILLLPLLLLAVLQALVRQDARLLIRACLINLPAAMLLTGLAVSVTQTALAVTDALSAELATGVAHDAHGLADALTKASAIGGPVPLFASFLMALVMALAAIFVWFELVLRAGVVYVAVMFLPLFLATMIWPALSGWVRRLVQLITAAVLSKLVIVATLSLGLSALTSGDGPSALLAGAGMFLLAAFSPFVLFSLVPLAAEVAQPQREARHAVATTTGTSLAWSVARTRMPFGAVGAGAGALALGEGAMGVGGQGGGGTPGAGAPPPAVTVGGVAAAKPASPPQAPGAAMAAAPPVSSPTSLPIAPASPTRPAGPPPGAQPPLPGSDGP